MNALNLERRDVRLLGLTGSLRAGSYSTAILRELSLAAPTGINIQILFPRLPLYDEDDVQADTLEAVQVFREAIADADGLVICTPEYNHGIPGVLKNALDWASRPSGRSVLKDKPVLVISNSPAFTGGVRAQAQLHETLLATDATILSGKQVVIGGVKEKIRDGAFVDKSNLAFALAELARLATHCLRTRTSGAGQ